MRFVHNLSKEARQRIVEVMLQNRTAKELAEELGLSEAAISKFRRGRIHPSDETVIKIMEIAEEDELSQIVEVIVDDLMDAVRDLMTDERAKDRVLQHMKSMLELEEREKTLLLHLV
ncbi:MAG: helix-turn-helix domain-containing protein [Thermoprotei archaeon]